MQMRKPKGTATKVKVPSVTNVELFPIFRPLGQTTASFLTNALLSV